MRSSELHGSITLRKERSRIWKSLKETKGKTICVPTGDMKQVGVGGGGDDDDDDDVDNTTTITFYNSNFNLLITTFTN